MFSKNQEPYYLKKQEKKKKRQLNTEFFTTFQFTLPLLSFLEIDTF